MKILLLGILASFGFFEDVYKKESLFYKLKLEEKKIIQEFCNLRGITFNDFMSYANFVKNDVFNKINNLDELSKAEDILDYEQKKEIKNIFREQGFTLDDNDIIQFKEEFNNKSANISVLACQSCPKVITNKKFWNNPVAWRKVALRHEASHVRHEDYVTTELMQGYWEYVKKDRAQDQTRFDEIYNKFKKFQEKRADLEALLSSTEEEIQSFVNQLKIDSSWDTAVYIFTEALKNDDLIDAEKKHFKECLEYLTAANGRLNLQKKDFNNYVQTGINKISSQKERFVFMKDPITSRLPNYPSKPNYPSFLERFEYCTEIIGNNS